MQRKPPRRIIIQEKGRTHARNQDGGRATLDERKLMDEMSRSILMVRAEIGFRSGFSKDKTTRILNALASRGLVAREGAGRGTRYRMV